MDDDFRLLDTNFEDVFKGSHELSHEPSFSLFDLPAEIWLQICEYAVTKCEGICVTRARKSQHQQQIVRQPAITRTCKLLRREALPLFYRLNTFEAYPSGRTCIQKWFAAIGAGNLRNMQTFVIHAKFEPEFWVEIFADIGIATSVKGTESTFFYNKLVVSFL